MPVGEDDDGEVGEAEVQAGIAVVQAEDQTMVLPGQPVDPETTVGTILQERSRCLRAEPAAEHVVGLSRDRRGDDQFPRFRLEDLTHQLASRVAAVGKRNQWGGIDDEGQSPNPSRSSSSGTSATELPSPSAHAVSAKRRSEASRDS